ncbi:ribonuclease domain-containing protein [Parapedobacter tibetensis]|uniref:ribonuclease domain-containing protein n=1 Tax=Parapedobacter tibetensis TaxID=2972951 RepID=UPI00214D803D|nr:ribonuclease domain-containing protein [Parapedobacter tibetensis]
MSEVLKYRMPWLIKILLSLISIFIFQFTIVVAFANFTNSGLDPHSPTSYSYTYDEIESSVWAEAGFTGGLGRILSKDKTGSECEVLADVVSVAAKGAGQLSTRFVSTSKGLTDLQPTLNRIASGGKFPHRNDGSIFKNLEGLLPKQNSGFYREFVHPTPGVTGPGPMRIVTGQNGQMWFTPDHYKTFIPIR